MPALATGSVSCSAAKRSPLPYPKAHRDRHARWAAIVALAGEQAHAASAQTLRALLVVPASAWGFHRVVAASAQPEDRRRLINWLLRSEPRDGAKLHPDSLAQRALAWWQARYVAARREKGAQENPLLPWRGSLARRRCRLEDALLQLYTDPEDAAYG